MTMRRTIITIISALAATLACAQTYLATDKYCYVAGDRIWCSAFSDAAEPVVYIELLSSEGPAARGRIAMLDGRGGGSLRIPFGTPTGNYRLAAYVSGETPDMQNCAVISVFNTLSVSRVPEGVESVQSLPTGPTVQSGYGLSADTSGSIVLENTSGRELTLCVSLSRDDSLQPAAFRSISSFRPAARSRGANRKGESLKAVMVGSDAAQTAAEALLHGEIDALLGVPGGKTECCVALPSADGSFVFETENIYGDVDVVCMLRGVDKDRDCHLELQQPFVGGTAQDLPKLRICPSQEKDLVRRSGAMLAEARTDTLIRSLPLPADHFFLDNECISYELDDYARFPTMEELFVEITPNIKMRRRGGKVYLYLLKERSVYDAAPRWGDAMAMIDGVPVPDNELIASYDPALVKTVESYPYSYSLGGKVFDGVVNFVTFKGNMPGLSFDDNIRIYGFAGCSIPESHEGSETIYWHPLVKLAPGEKLSLPSGGLAEGVRYRLSAEGLTDGGLPVYLQKTFER